MLNFFLHCARSINTRYPIERHDCGAIISEYSWDLSSLKQRGAEKVTANVGGYDVTFIYKLCDGLEPLDLPYKFNYSQHYSFAVCLDNRKACWPLASKWDLDYAPLQPLKNFSQGIRLQMTSDPIKAFLNTLATWKVEFDVTCDPNQEDPLKEVTPTVTSGTVNEIKFTLPYSKGCGVDEAKTPTPTPEYTPQCEFDARDPDNQLEGISMDVREANGGPFGHLYFDNINKTDYFIFYQPCERSKNPAHPYDDKDSELASVWLCNDEITSCRSLGIVDNHTKMEMVPNDFT